VGSPRWHCWIVATANRSNRSIENTQSLTLAHLVATREISERIAATIAQETPLQIEGEPVSQKLQLPSTEVSSSTEPRRVQFDLAEPALE